MDSAAGRAEHAKPSARRSPTDLHTGISGSVLLHVHVPRRIEDCTNSISVPIQSDDVFAFRHPLRVDSAGDGQYHPKLRVGSLAHVCSNSNNVVLELYR